MTDDPAVQFFLQHMRMMSDLLSAADDERKAQAEIANLQAYGAMLSLYSLESHLTPLVERPGTEWKELFVTCREVAANLK